MGSVGKDSTASRIAELQAQLAEAKGLFAKARIEAEIEMLKAGFTGTVDEWRAQRQAERERKQAEANAEYERRREAEERAKREAEEAKRQTIEREMQTMPEHIVEQYKITQQYNPMHDEYHTGIRKPSDIVTWEQAVQNADSEGAFAWGDFNKADAERALKAGKITIYSSYPIKQGVFVSTSKRQAEEYAGGVGKHVYTKTVPLKDVAWISGDEGQFAKVRKK